MPLPYKQVASNMSTPLVSSGAWSHADAGYGSYVRHQQQTTIDESPINFVTGTQDSKSEEYLNWEQVFTESAINLVDEFSCPEKVTSFTQTEWEARSLGVQTFLGGEDKGIDCKLYTPTQNRHMQTMFSEQKVKQCQTNRISCVDSGTEMQLIKTHSVGIQFEPNLPYLHSMGLNTCMHMPVNLVDAKV
jgi:hypothetical protein